MKATLEPSPPRNVLLVAHTSEQSIGGGAERTRGLAQGFRALGATVDWFELEPDSSLRHRRPAPWWFHRLSAARQIELQMRCGDADAVVVCYLPVAAAVRPALATSIADPGTRVIYAAENDEVALSERAMPRHHRNHVKLLQAAVLDFYPEIWVPGRRDAEVLRAAGGSYVQEVPSGVRTPVLSHTPKPHTGGRPFTYGSWSFAPNRHGLAHLLSACHSSSAELDVYGVVAPSDQRKWSAMSRANIEVHWRGFADSLADMPDRSGGAGLVPVWEGAGTKLRTVELAAAGVPVFGPQAAFVGLPSWLRVHVYEDPAELLARASSAKETAWKDADVLRRRVLRELHVDGIVAAAWFNHHPA